MGPASLVSATTSADPQTTLGAALDGRESNPLPLKHPECELSRGPNSGAGSELLAKRAHVWLRRPPGRRTEAARPLPRRRSRWRRGPRHVAHRRPALTFEPSWRRIAESARVGTPGPLQPELAQSIAGARSRRWWSRHTGWRAGHSPFGGHRKRKSPCHAGARQGPWKTRR